MQEHSAWFTRVKGNIRRSAARSSCTEIAAAANHNLTGHRVEYAVFAAEAIDSARKIGGWHLRFTSAATILCTALREDVLDHIAMNVGKPEVPTCPAIGEPLMIEAQQVQKCGVQIVNMDTVFDRFEP